MLQFAPVSISGTDVFSGLHLWRLCFRFRVEALSDVFTGFELICARARLNDPGG